MNSNIDNENVINNINQNNIENKCISNDFDNNKQDLAINTNLREENCEKEMIKSKKFFNKANFIQFVKFSAFSLSAGAIQLLSFELLYDVIGWKQWWATYLISIVLSVIWNFTFNRKFTFKSASNVPVAMSFAFLFYLFFIPVSVFGGQALENIGWNGTVVTVVMMLINFVLEYMWDKFLVFNDKIMNNIKKRKIQF